SSGTVLSEDPVEIDLGEIAAGAQVSVSFEVEIANPVPAGTGAIINQGTLTSDQLPAVLTDDPDLGGDADPTETMIQAEPRLTVEKVDVLFDDAGGDGVASPGDVLLYQLSVDNDGNTAATGVVLTDQIPEHTVLEAGSVQTSQGSISSVDPIEITLGQVNVGVTATVSFRARIDELLPTDVLAVSNQATVSSVELADVASDDPGEPGDADPTATEVFVTPDVQVDDVTVTEGDPGDTVEATFTVSLSEPGNRPVSVAYQTAAGTAAADLDYASAAGSVTFAAGETSRAITVTVFGDLLDEHDETFSVTLSGVEGGTLVDSEGLGTIVDDDPLPALQITDVTVTEGDSGLTEALFTVSLSAPSGRQV
ncbi:MAG: DUF11 domain-containing protein, partial [Colwellia sp.]|nr:DUF11 domain-containing protein [Colwellia sp.]